MRTLLTCITMATMLTTTLHAQSTTGEELLKDTEDGSWIGVSGTVEKSSSTGSFVLDYGEGTILVNVDPEAIVPHEFTANEAVTVYGILDEGFFKAATINARTVYLESMKSYACSMDGADNKVASFVPAIHTASIVHGRVTKVSGDNFMVNEGGTMITVDASGMKGTTKGDTPAVQVGDRVTVIGDINKSFFSGRKLAATSMNVIR